MSKRPDLKPIQRQHNVDFLARVMRVTKKRAAQIIDSKLQPVKRDPIAGAREQLAMVLRTAPQYEPAQQMFTELGPLAQTEGPGQSAILPTTHQQR